MEATVEVMAVVSTVAWMVCCFLTKVVLFFNIRIHVHYYACVCIHMHFIVFSHALGRAAFYKSVTF